MEAINYLIESNLSLEETTPPKKSVKAYKLFRTDPKHPNKLFALFVNADKPIETGKWLKAEIGPMVDGKVKSKLGKLAFRPGWHSGDLPIATHIGELNDTQKETIKKITELRNEKIQDMNLDKKKHKKEIAKINKEFPYPKWAKKPSIRPKNQVWAEIEVADDYDWHTEAQNRAEKSKTGKIKLATAHITDQVPHKGHYRYKTNSNMTGSWLISGEMKVNRILSDREVEEINSRAGTADLPRLTNIKLKENISTIFEMAPPPDDWSLDTFDKSFAAQLRYAKERAATIGSGSSRVAFIIPYQGRETVLKIAKNKKGLAQNEKESDYSLYRMYPSITIPMIDYDEEHSEPTWIHFEKAEKLTESQFKKIEGFSFKDFGRVLQDFHNNNNRNKNSWMYNSVYGMNQETIEKIKESEIFNEVADMAMNFDLLIPDFTRKANWGIYDGHPVIIDLGFDTNIQQLYYSPKR